MIFLGLGTNIGNKSANITQALSLLSQYGVEPIRVSSLYHTPPWGILAQEAFINAVCEVRFSGSPQELLEIVLKIEALMGRVREIKWGPRIIDIDIIEFHSKQIDLPHLKIPHPFYIQRAFVLVPLAELAPNWTPTSQKKNIKQLLEQLPTQDIKPLDENGVI